MSVVTSIDTHDLVSSKENIQPLRKGRDTAILCAALQAETDTDLHQELEKQRNEFEIKLRSNTSEDPLSDWCNYIHWIEQSFPRQGREGKLNVVLQKCLNKFKDCEKYMNDLRFVRLCIKYAELEDNTVELLSQIHRHGIGVSCAELFIAWAEKYALDNCFKKANAIYERGLQCSAQPIEKLQEAYQNFQAFLVRKMLNDRETFQPTVRESTNPADVRQPYNVLQSVSTGQREVVPSVRVGSNVIGKAGKFQKNAEKDHKPKSNTMVKIFEDSEGAYAPAEPKAKIEKVLSKKAITKENTVKPGPWNNKKNRNAVFSVDTPAALPFEVHRDEEKEENDRKSKSVPPSVLKAHKPKSDYEDENYANAPLFYSEPYDPTKQSMYCKEQVYAGGLEFQFEELRAIQYRRKKEEELARARLLAPKVVPCEQVQAPQAQDKYRTPSNTKSESRGKSTEKSKSKSNYSGKKDKSESRRKTLFKNPPPLVGVAEENVPSTDFSMNQTIHTKEALSEMQQLWFSKPASPVSLVPASAPVAKSILKPSKPCFQLYVDESCLENFKPPSASESDENRPLDLTLKSGNQSDSDVPPGEPENLNPSLGVRRKAALSDKFKDVASQNKENCYVGEERGIYEDDKVRDDEDKENGIPAGYMGPVGKSTRKVSGILTPAENVEMDQLSDEEVEIEVDDDEVVAAAAAAAAGGEVDEEDEGNPQDFSSIIQCNTTAITETWNFTKGFQFPRGESTPNMLKSFKNKVDCDESVLASELKPAPEKKGDTRAECPSRTGDKPTGPVHGGDRKPAGGDADTANKNLSVIAETSREYRSSSSASSGTSTLALRSSKNFPYTPSDIRNSKYNLTSSHTIQRTKVQSYTGYEASSESSNFARANNEDGANTTFNLMKKLNAIDSLSSVNTCCDEEENDVAGGVDQMKISEDVVQKPSEPEPEPIDPFSEDVIEGHLRDVEFPTAAHSSGYFLLHDTDLPNFKVGSTVTLGAFTYDVKKVLGEGAYARVYRLSETRTGECSIAKYQKPAFPWEFYIAREIQARIKDADMAARFMNIETAYFYKNSSVLLSRPLEFGDLLTVINKMKQGKMMCQSLAMHFTCQILEILQTLHSCRIIHGDIKPDNFLLRYHNDKLQLQLIDFGRGIDMSLYPEGTTFTRVVTTEGFTTTEMKSGKPWTYQIDLYGAANCGHCLLFGDYMKVTERDGVWSISKIIPRYWARTEWKNFFASLLNVESCSKQPDLSDLIQSFESVLAESSEIEFSLFKLDNLLNDR